MDDDWDADDFVPPPPIVNKEQPKSQWDDEDKEEEEPVKESWEDEEKPKPAPKPEKPKAEKKDKKKAAPASDKKEALQEQKPSDPLAEKLKQQRLIEEADYQVTTELFKKDGEGAKSLEAFIPKSEADFLEYAELVSHKIVPFQKSFHYLTLLKAIVKHCTPSMSSADVKELSSAVTVIANEKLKAEKEAAGKKKGGVKKKQLHVDKVDEDNYTQAYDDVDDYDFM